MTSLHWGTSGASHSVGRVFDGREALLHRFRIVLGCALLLSAGPLAANIANARAASITFAMIGDSITWQATADLEAAIPGIRIDSDFGRPFSHAAEVLDRILVSGTPDVLIVALGTNPPLSIAQVDEFMGLTSGIEHVVFVNTRIPREWEAEINNVINNLPLRYEKVSVVDWYGYSATRPFVFNPSGFHLSDEGKPIYANLVASGAFRAGGVCVDDGTAPDVCDLGGTFFDDDESTFEDDIEWIAAQGITLGCNPPLNSRYCPNAYVTRGQMAAFLTRALHYTDTGPGNIFTDDDGSTFETEIDKLATAGVTTGCNPPDNTHYCPNQYVTRGQMAAFLTRALDQ